MAIVLATIASLVVSIVAALVLLLFVPADYSVFAGTQAGVRLRLRWGFGLVRMAYDSSALAERAVERARPRRRHADRGTRLAGRLLAIDGLVARIVRLGRDLVQSLGWRRGRLAVRMGLDDPADTGELCGLVAPALVALPERPALEVEFEPDFTGPRFDAEAEGSGRFVPARAVAALGRFALSGPGRRAIGEMLWNRGR